MENQEFVNFEELYEINQLLKDKKNYCDGEEFIYINKSLLETIESFLKKYKSIEFYIYRKKDNCHYKILPQKLHNKRYNYDVKLEKVNKLFDLLEIEKGTIRITSVYYEKFYKNCPNIKYAFHNMIDLNHIRIIINLIFTGKSIKFV